MDHINNSSNPHLHNAILKYGLFHYAFVILEYYLSSDLLKREQHFLDLLDTLSFFPISLTFGPSSYPPPTYGRGEQGQECQVNIGKK